MVTASLIVAMFALMSCAETQAKELSKRWGEHWLFRFFNFLFCLLSVTAFLFLTYYIAEINK